MTQDEFDERVEAEARRWPLGLPSIVPPPPAPPLIRRMSLAGIAAAGMFGFAQVVGPGGPIGYVHSPDRLMIGSLFGVLVGFAVFRGRRAAAPPEPDARATGLMRARHAARIDTAFIDADGWLTFASDDGIYLGPTGRFALFDAEIDCVASIAYDADAHAIRVQTWEAPRDEDRTRRSATGDDRVPVTTDVLLPATTSREEGEARGLALSKLAYNVKHTGGP